MVQVTICSDFGAMKIKSVTVSVISASICHEVIRLDVMILERTSTQGKAAWLETQGCLVVRTQAPAPRTAGLHCCPSVGALLPLLHCTIGNRGS